jgi:hypothetical protein
VACRRPRSASNLHDRLTNPIGQQLAKSSTLCLHLTYATTGRVSSLYPIYIPVYSPFFSSDNLRLHFLYPSHCFPSYNTEVSSMASIHLANSTNPNSNGNSTPEHDRDTHLLGVGKQCSDPSCYLVDFLPFKCQHCELSFCQEHFKVDVHHCTKYDESKHNRVAPNCTFRVL